MYTEALGGVHAYVIAAMATCNYVEPTPTASKSIIFRQLFASSSHLCISNIHFNKIFFRLLACFLFLPYHFYNGKHQGEPL